MSTLVGERAWNTALLGTTALLLATLIGHSRGNPDRQPARSARGGLLAACPMVLVSVPPLVTSFMLLLVASRTGWFPVGGFAAGSARRRANGRAPRCCRASRSPIPLAATLERLQSQALREALGEPSIRAAIARGCSPTRVIWRHALRLALPPVLAVYGVMVGVGAERIVCGRGRHVVAGPRRADV